MQLHRKTHRKSYISKYPCQVKAVQKSYHERMPQNLMGALITPQKLLGQKLIDTSNIKYL